MTEEKKNSTMAFSSSNTIKYSFINQYFLFLLTVEKVTFLNYPTGKKFSQRHKLDIFALQFFDKISVYFPDKNKIFSVSQKKRKRKILYEKKNRERKITLYSWFMLINQKVLFGFTNTTIQFVELTLVLRNKDEIIFLNSLSRLLTGTQFKLNLLNDARFSAAFFFCSSLEHNTTNKASNAIYMRLFAEINMPVLQSIHYAINWN